MKNPIPSTFAVRLLSSGASMEARRFGQELAAAAHLNFESYASDREFRAWARTLAPRDSGTWLVILPADAGGNSIFPLLSWIKRHPDLHFASVIVIARSLTEPERQEYLRSGAWQVLTDLGAAALQKTLAHLSEVKVDAGEFAHIEGLFASELVERIAESRDALADFQEASAARMYRAFHALKGSAQTLHYPVLARLLHHAETVLETVQAGGNFDSREARQLLLGVLDFVEKQQRRISSREILDEEPRRLHEELAGFLARNKAGPRGFPAGRVPIERLKTLVAKAHGASGPELAEIGRRLDVVLALNEQISVLAEGLRKEFSDEGFPAELCSLTQEIGKEASEALRLADGLQSVPLHQLKGFLERTVAEAAVRLGKTALFRLELKTEILLSPQAFSGIKRICMHLARNAVDHGLEFPKRRRELGKEERGEISLSAAEDSNGSLLVRFEDDGAGVDLSALKDFFRSQGAAAASVLDRLSEQQALQLVFSGSFSSRPEVSDISGRGIGLSDVKQQVVELGGRIEVSSTAGKGTCFTIVLPAHKARQHGKEKHSHRR